MKLIHSFGPNPRIVRMFMCEKNLTLPEAQLDLRAGENRQAAHLARNPAGQSPTLELDDGTFLSETVAICEYLEELHPAPALIGATPRERAEQRMWQRRVELNITEARYNGFRYAEGLEMFKSRVHCIPAAAGDLKQASNKALAWLDPLIAGRAYLCGDAIRLADIVLYCCLDFTRGVGQPFDPELKNVAAWFARVDARPSAEKSLHPAAAQRKLRG